MEIDVRRIRRINSNMIRLAPGLTATQGYDGSLPSLSIRRDGKRVAYYRGSSLQFGAVLSDEDCDYLKSLAE